MRTGYLLRRPAHHLPKESPDRDGNGVLERCVLVVDGDNDIRDLLSQALADNGCDVRAAASGHEALELLRGCRPRLILLDLMTPALDRWASLAMQETRRDLVSIPIVVMSASYNLVPQALRTADMLAKPVDVDELLAKVNNLAR